MESLIRPVHFLRQLKAVVTLVGPQLQVGGQCTIAPPVIGVKKKPFFLGIIMTRMNSKKLAGPG